MTLLLVALAAHAGIGVVVFVVTLVLMWMAQTVQAGESGPAGITARLVVVLGALAAGALWPATVVMLVRRAARRVRS